jgi:hypothetical protein
MSKEGKTRKVRQSGSKKVSKKSDVGSPKSVKSKK